MENSNEQQSHCGQQGSTQDGGIDLEETKIGNNSLEASKSSGKTEQRSGEDFSKKEEQEKGGDPDNLSETTGGNQSGGEDKSSPEIFNTGTCYPMSGP